MLWLPLYKMVLFKQNLVEPRSNNFDPGLVEATGQTWQLYTTKTQKIQYTTFGSRPSYPKLPVSKSF